MTNTNDSEGNRAEHGGSIVLERDSVVIRFAGDSGDGMQLTGTEFTRTSALRGNDIATFPDYPAEIRAPAGSLGGVSGYQLQFSSTQIFTAGDAPDVLVAMNPAALKRNVGDLVPGGILILDSGAFKKRNLELAGYEKNPAEDGSLSAFRVVEIDFMKHINAVLKGSGLSTRDAQRTRNFFALGLLFWLFGREDQVASEIAGIRERFAKKADLADANVNVFQAGFHFGETAELFDATYRVPAAKLTRGRYRNITGNEAAAIGIAAAGKLSGLRVMYGTYPITPASDILHYLARYGRWGVTMFQAEDEIAAVAAAIGASFGGALGVTGTSGPGMALKQEAIGLAVMTELPLLVINVQRAGPSTGMPTKTEQADLFQAVLGRNGEAPVAVMAAQSASDCFDTVIEAARIAVEHMTPVVVLSDGAVANGSEPWLLPKVEDLEPIRPRRPDAADAFLPYGRDSRLVRPWAVPGLPGFEHRIGGLEKEDGSGVVSYDPMNHERMTRIRAAKIEKISERLPLARVDGPETGDVLLVGWGGTFGALYQAAQRMREDGHAVGHLHLRYLNPLQSNVGELLRGYRTVVVAELNGGQLRSILRDRFLVDCKGLSKVQGQPFKVREVIAAVQPYLAASSVQGKAQEVRS
jgi:2-oxoglutarate ferredoxin oxidoreductase subunit alpha